LRRVSGPGVDTASTARVLLAAETSMRIRMVCLEDGIISCGFRKMAAFAERLNPDTLSCYVSTQNYRSLLGAIRGTFGGRGELDAEAVDEIARELVDADVLGFSSMTGYADLTKAVIHRVRELSRRPYIIWGGIHPIIQPEDAIAADVDAICTGEGEFAFAEFLDAFRAGRDFSATSNFWFKSGETITRNAFLPLQTAEELETLPFPQYAVPAERIYKKGRGFVPLGRGDYLATNGLSYTALWSIGCPLHCTFCGNTKFIANDPKYKKLRHPTARYIVEEVKEARRKLPHVSTVIFQDDSFMAIPYREIERFAELWHDEVKLPFAVYGVIPSYVRRDKFEVLTWAGMNRIRMGIQSGSKRILDFYKRPTPIEKVEAAGEVNAAFSPRYHIPPAYDIIMDNPVETREDVVDTLELIYRLARPFTLLIYSLKVIPNTELERQLREHGVDLDEIDANYSTIPARWANLLLYLLALWRPPRPLFERLLRRVEASSTLQRSYPVLGGILRSLYILKRALYHLWFMDFSIIPGRSGYVAWRLGLVSFWWRHMTPRPPRPPGAASGPTRPIPVLEPAASGSHSPAG
jgi:anaerobic magnesium-protoporphyrin IX monomethyl ester cyclase